MITLSGVSATLVLPSLFPSLILLTTGVSGTRTVCVFPGVILMGVLRALEGVVILMFFLGDLAPFLGLLLVSVSNIRFLLTVLTVFLGLLAAETDILLFLTLVTFLLVTILPVVVWRPLARIFSLLVGARLMDLFSEVSKLLGRQLKLRIALGKSDEKIK